jgi:hypothetical protein
MFSAMICFETRRRCGASHHSDPPAAFLAVRFHEALHSHDLERPGVEGVATWAAGARRLEIAGDSSDKRAGLARSAQGAGDPMPQSRIALALFAAMACALAGLVCVPLGIQAASLLTMADDPAEISDRALKGAFDRGVAANEIEAALAANDADLAQSFVDLARDRGVAVPPELVQRVAAAVERANSALAAADSFARGLIVGEPDDAIGLAGTALGDLFVYGDIRDAAREGSRFVRGAPADELVLGLACVGLAITAGTYASLGAAVPARVGLSVVKAASKTARIGGDMAGWIGRSLREVVDWSALGRAGGAIAEPATAVRAARQAVKLDKAGDLFRLASDVGRVQSRAGTQAALDGLKLARDPREMARIAALAEKKGGKTRAILKTLGRGAILLTVASFNLALWVLGAIATLVGFVASTKSAVERMTLRHLARKRERQFRRQLALQVGRA